jgi:pimeloyl-ACP methyl ester carboxylesterase
VVAEPKCPDAVILVPGILGSELVDVATGDVVWGLRPKVLAKALITGSTFDRLRRDGLRCGGLIRFPGALFGLSRFEPYTRIVRRLQTVCRHPDAVVSHPYDWRKALEETSLELAGHAHDHLASWRSRSEGSRESRLVFVAHSMGGLLAWHAVNRHLDAADVALVVTLGTPFGGSVRAVKALGSGDVLTLGVRAEKVRDCARQLPSLYDLLPTYPCLTTKAACRRPDVADFVAGGAERDLLAQSTAARAALEHAVTAPGHDAPALMAVTGTRQQTLQSFTLSAGELSFHEHLDGTNWSGDGTVYVGAATTAGGGTPVPLPQQHGALANGGYAIGVVTDTLTGTLAGPPMGNGIGLAAPDVAVAGQPFEIRVAAPKFAGVGCRLEEPEVRDLGLVPLIQRTTDLGEPEQFGTVVVDSPGLYTVRVSGGGFADLRRDVLVWPR